LLDIHSFSYFFQISFNPAIITQLTINGIVDGLFFALMGLGFSTILEGMDLFNFAHGAFYMVGGYVTYLVIKSITSNSVIAIISSIIIAFLLGYAVDLLMLRPIRRREKEGWTLAGLIGLLSLSVVLENSAIIVFGPEHKGVPPYVQGNIVVGSSIVDTQRVVSALLAALLVLSTYLFFKKTKYGRAMRALAQNKELAEISGVDPERMYPSIFGLGVCLAAAAGSLLSPLYYVSPTIGAFPGLMAFIVVIVSGLGSIGGLILTGILFGIVSNFTAFFYSTEWAHLVAFTIAVVVITFKPTGLFGVRRE